MIVAILGLVLLFASGLVYWFRDKLLPSGKPLQWFGRNLFGMKPPMTSTTTKPTFQPLAEAGTSSSKATTTPQTTLSPGMTTVPTTTSFTITTAPPSTTALPSTTPPPSTTAPPAPTATPSSGVLGRYVRVYQTKTTAQMMNLMSLTVFSGGIDIARSKTVTVLPGLYSASFPGSNLTDGDLTTMAHSSSGINCSMTVDLLTSYPIQKIQIFNRTTCCFDRIVGARVDILDGNKNVIYSSDVISLIFSKYELQPPSREVVGTGVI